MDIVDLKTTDFEIVFSNDYNEKLVVGYDANKKQFFIDRKNAGVSKFHEGFAAVATAPRFAEDAKMDLTILLDKTSIELFTDGGCTVMTALFFPTHPYTKWKIVSKEKIASGSLKLFSLK